MYADELYLLRVEGDLIATVGEGKDAGEITSLRLIEIETLCQEVEAAPEVGRAEPAPTYIHTAVHVIFMYVCSCNCNCMSGV